jgi:hypothetical protein
VTDRNRAAIDVDLGGIPAEVLVDRAGLRGEGLIGLDQIEDFLSWRLFGGTTD